MASPLFSTNDASSPYNVRLGIWTNWSRGANMGLTLTLTRQNADLVIAFTAFFVSFVGARFWRVVCFTAHHFFSSPDPKDALHHQRQVVLRNSSTAESGLWSFVQLIWAWRSRAARHLLRLLPMCCIAMLSVLAFVTAGGFSARMSTSIGDEVLIDGSNCSIFSTGSSPVYEDFHELDIWYTNILSNARNYAQQCYTTDGATSTSTCGTLVKERLSSLQNTSASCPFKDQVCRTQSSNIILDSGYVDSHFDLGLNSPPDERILLRYRMHCAPLEVEGFISNVTINNVNYTRYNYGPNSAGKGNFTEQVLAQESQYVNGNFSPDGSEYRLT
jgi:hypothetical protein